MLGRSLNRLGLLSIQRVSDGDESEICRIPQSLLRGVNRRAVHVRCGWNRPNVGQRVANPQGSLRYKKSAIALSTDVASCNTPVFEDGTSRGRQVVRRSLRKVQHEWFLCFALWILPSNVSSLPWAAIGLSSMWVVAGIGLTSGSESRTRQGSLRYRERAMALRQT